MTAPAAMPSVEDVARAIRDEYGCAPACDYPVCIGGECGHECERDDRSVGAFHDAARAILDLFAPILAEKEREIERACAYHANATIGWERERGLREAAEAALAPFADEKNGVMQDLLWGDQPDSATMTITCPLGQVRKAREVVRAAAIRAQD